MELITTKMAIPHETTRLSRSRLLEVLRESLNCCSSTVITGRAGTGKTMLAADFARRCGRRVAWYKVEAPDEDLRIFLPYLVASVARVRPGFGGRALAYQAQAESVDLATLAEFYVHDLQKQSEPLLMVIDDLHLVYDADWVAPFFHRLLPLLPSEVHLLILGRSLPPAPLWRMRSKQTLCVIDEPTLCFTQPEAEALFASYGLSAAQASLAFQQTRGRAAALDAAAQIGRASC